MKKHYDIKKIKKLMKSMFKINPEGSVEIIETSKGLAIKPKKKEQK